MVRRPTRTSALGLSSFRLGDRMRDLQIADRLSDADTKRLERLLEDRLEEGGLRGADLDDFIVVHDPKRPKFGDITETIKARDFSRLVTQESAAAEAVVVSGKSGLHSVTSAVMERLRTLQPGTLPDIGLEAGRSGADLPVQTTAFCKLVQIAAIEICDGQRSVIWDDGINQLVVHPARIKLTVTDGRIEVLVPVQAEKLTANMIVPFATGSEERLAGLVMATLDRPAGDAVVSRIWGDALIALSHRSLIAAIESLAGASGRDSKNNRLVPRALAAQRGQLTIQSQARFLIKGEGR